MVITPEALLRPYEKLLSLLKTPKVCYVNREKGDAEHVCPNEDETRLPKIARYWDKVLEEHYMSTSFPDGARLRHIVYGTADDLIAQAQMNAGSPTDPNVDKAIRLLQSAKDIQNDSIYVKASFLKHSLAARPLTYGQLYNVISKFVMLVKDNGAQLDDVNAAWIRKQAAAAAAHAED